MSTGTPGKRTAAYEVKASTFRAYLSQLEKLGVVAELRAKVPEETRAAIDAPPLPSAWIDAILIEDVMGALAALRGLDAVRQVTKDGQKAMILPIVRPIITGLLRLFGATPATLLARFPEFTRTQQHGIQFQWKSESPKGGHLTVSFPRKNLPRHVFIGQESACELILELCGLKGSVSATDMNSDGSAGTIRVSW